MKQIFVAILFIALISNSCKKGPDLKSIDGCPVDSLISAGYLHDAQEIVYRRIISGQPVIGSGQPQFNQQELNRVLSAIQSVYSLHSAQTDSIFNTYQIHAFKRYLLNSIILKVNMNAPEINNLISQKPTGNVAFDALLAKYDFSYTYDSAVPPDAASPYLVITSSNWYNTAALLPQFRSFPFILSEEDNGEAWDVNDITYQLTGPNRILDFSISYGDCIEGCLFKKTWEFNVDENCHARLLKVFNK